LQREFALINAPIFRDCIMPLAEINEVVFAPVDSTGLLGFSIDEPKAGIRADCYAIKIAGWALSEVHEPITIRAKYNERTLWATNRGCSRPDLAELYPHLPLAAKSGFRMIVNLLGLPLEAGIDIYAEVGESPAVRIGTIHFQRVPLRSPYIPSMQPILLNNLGRSGSKWLTTLIAQHAEVLAWRPYELEPRTIHYWVSILERLSNPNSYMQILAADLSRPHYWMAAQQPIAIEEFPNDAMVPLLGHASIEATGAFCQEQVERFYRQIAMTERKTDARYFIEKHVPNPYLTTFIRELYPAAREIFLVRDLRDVFCSMAAFNARLNGQRFLREKFSTDSQFVSSLRQQALALLKEWKARSGTAFLVRYEDLIRNPVPTLRSVLDYLGVPSTPAIVEGILRRASSVAAGEHQTSSSAESSIGRWQHDLSPDLVTSCGEAFAEIMEEFGYMP
jgi:hypothetical protein